MFYTGKKLNLLLKTDLQITARKYLSPSNNHQEQEHGIILLDTTKGSFPLYSGIKIRFAGTLPLEKGEGKFTKQ